ncbi:MAG: Hsp70 family protein [Bradymonadia bacterium]
MSAYVGLDFGTTNSALAIAPEHGPAHLIPLTGPQGTASICRSIMFFERGMRATDLEISIGAQAVHRYVETGGEGRLIQSIKSHLASGLFSETRVINRRFDLPDLIGVFLQHLRRHTDVDLGDRVVVGRPVRYWGAKDAEDEARALERMQAALALAGFHEVVFEYEPVAAALKYGSGLHREELVLIADFGGGTSDFSLIKVGPGVDPEDPDTILGTGGVGIGGDTFDGRIIHEAVAPALGYGSTYDTPYGKTLPIPAWIYGKLERWHHLSFLKSPDTLKLLREIASGAEDPDQIEALIALVDENLGHPLHQAVERTKVALSGDDSTRFRFDLPPLDLTAAVQRATFNDWISPDLATIDAVITDLLDSTGVSADQIDRVFTTGGSSLVPAVRGMLTTRFGADRLAAGDELTSVATGLAIRARSRFK